VAVFLEVAELFVAVGEGALEVGFVALESGEGIGAVVLIDEVEGEELGAGEGLVLVAVAALVELAIDFGLGVGEAAETPGELGDAFGEIAFGGGFGLEGVLHFVAVHVVGEAVLGGENGGAAHAVFEGVLGGSAFAGEGFGAGGLEGVGAVGEELFLGAGGCGAVFIRAHRDPFWCALSHLLENVVGRAHPTQGDPTLFCPTRWRDPPERWTGLI